MGGKGEFDVLHRILAGDEIDWEPRRLVFPGPWSGHIPFAFWLVKASAPRLLVELGTHTGNSYAAFCQAIDALDLPTSAFAVDTWLGDEHAGSYGEEVFSELSRFNRENYGGFSTLVRKTFDEAKEHFSPGSIDLLHIDGMHTYEAVRHDFETWRGHLSDRAVVLFHDTNVRERDFGVWKLWRELSALYPSFEFHHSNGLGVLGVGESLPPPLKALFEAGDDVNSQSLLRRAFARRGQIFQDRTEVFARDRAIADSYAELRRERSRAQAIEEEFRHLSGEAESREKQHLETIAEHRRLLERRTNELELTTAEARRLQQALDSRTLEIIGVHRYYRRSASWRLTTPFRGALSLVSKKHRRRNRAFKRSYKELIRNPHVSVSPFQGPVQTPAHDFKAVARVLMEERLQGFLLSGAPFTLPTHSEGAPDVSIVLVLFNQAELTYGCLASLKECLPDCGVTAEVIIIDNGSSDQTSALLDRIEGATIIRSPENLHFLRGVNRASQRARGRHILLLNNDAQLVAGSLENAVRRLDEDRTIGAVGGRIILPDGSLQEAGSIIWADGTCLGYARGRPASAPEAMFRRDVAYCSGAFLMTPRHVFETMSRFDEAFAPAYYEETDYCVRLWEAGLRVVYDPSIAIVHFEFGSAARPEEALARQKHNHDLFGHTHRHWLEWQVPAGGNVHRARFARSDAKHILFIEDRVPKPELGAGYPRANALLDSLQRQGAQVTLFPMSRHEETWTSVRDCVSPNVEVIIDGEAAALRDFLHERQGCYDAILVSRPHNMRALRAILDMEPELQAGSKLIYDAEAVFSRRDVLKAIVNGTPLTQPEQDKALREEVGLASETDLVVSVSGLEADLFKEAGVSNVVLLGHAVEVEPTENAFGKRDDILFLGATHSEDSPNGDSILWFVREILPHIRKELGRNLWLTIVGMVNAPAIEALDGKDVVLLGRMDDIAPTFANARLVVAPTRFAAGIPHKAHHAAALGVPIVATKLIAGQLGWKNGQDLLASDDPRAFAEHCVRLYRDAELWGRLRGNAAARVMEECSQEAFDRAVAGILDLVVPGGDGRPPKESNQRHLYVQRKRDADFSAQVPFGFKVEAPGEGSTIAAIIHLFYAEQAQEFRRYLSHLPSGANVFISTDTAEKKVQIESAFADFTSGHLDIRLVPNRGRDIAPKLIAFREVYADHDFILHLHSKASAHDDDLSLWRTYLLESLIGSREIVATHLWAMENGGDIGMIFPQHFDYVRQWIDWGPNLANALELTARLGHDLDSERALDFPSGSMFWARSAVFKPLLDLDLSAEDFPEEEGQTDATLAHAIERLYAIIVELSGYRWMKTARPELMVDHTGVVEIESPEAFQTFIRKHTVRITSADLMPVSQELYVHSGIVPQGLTEAVARQKEQETREPGASALS